MNQKQYKSAVEFLLVVAVVTCCHTGAAFSSAEDVARLREENKCLREELATYKLRELGVVVQRGVDGSVVLGFSAERFRNGNHLLRRRHSWREPLELVREFQCALRLEFPATTVRDNDLVVLSGLENVVGLNLGGTAISDAGLESIATLNGLQSLSLRDCPVTDDGMVHIAKLSFLRELNIQNGRYSEDEHYGLTDVGVGHLAGLSYLTYLNLTFANLSGEGLRHLARMKSLQQLHLADTPITDKGLGHLHGMKDLERLNLWRCVNITDAGLPYLAGLAKLRVVSLIKTKATENGVERLREHLPDLKVRLTEADPHYQ